MTPELRELIYKLLQVLGKMEVEDKSGRISTWIWDFEANKPKIVKIYRLIRATQGLSLIHI